MIGYILTAWGWISKLVNWKKVSKKVSGWCSWEVVACVAALGFAACVFFLVRENIRLKEIISAYENPAHKTSTTATAKDSAGKTETVGKRTTVTTAVDGSKTEVIEEAVASTYVVHHEDAQTATASAGPVFRQGIDSPRAVSQWGAVLLGAGYCGGWGPVVGVRILRVSILGGAVFADKVRPGALATVDVYRF